MPRSTSVASSILPARTRRIACRAASMSASETAAAVAAASGTALAAGGGEYDATVRGAAAAWAARPRLGTGGAAVLLEARDVGRGRGSGTLLGAARVLAAAFCGFCDLMAVRCLASAALVGGAAAAGLAPGRPQPPRGSSCETSLSPAKI